ncbi:threonine aldolase family protein [Sphingorhabdus sp. Alg231-15]|uniref:threonine aldolase family protein n=1 Tax=Sphingorhabdus sp. Alg231-15 TaxID=1922222 RepID=UPI00307B74C8
MSEEYYCKGEAISRLEHKVAALLGKPSALWCPTGTLAQGIAIRIHGERTGRNILQMHPTSHLVLHEEEGYKHAHGFEPSIVGEWRDPLEAGSMDKAAACMIVEMPQRHSGGVLPTWEKLEALKHKSHALDVPLHMDGARIWSCRPFYDQRTFAQIADGFSSVYVSFYKDIGAFGGAALVGDEDFIETARVWRSRLGGVVSEHWPVVCDTLRLLDTKLAQIDGLVEMTRSYASFVDETSQYPVYPNPPQSNFFHVLLPVPAHVAEAAQIEAAKETGVWFTNVFWNYESENTCAMEVKCSETTAAIPRELLENAFSKFFAHI